MAKEAPLFPVWIKHKILREVSHWNGWEPPARVTIDVSAVKSQRQNTGHLACLFRTPTTLLYARSQAVNTGRHRRIMD